MNIIALESGKCSITPNHDIFATNRLHQTELRAPQVAQAINLCKMTENKPKTSH